MEGSALTRKKQALLIVKIRSALLVEIQNKVLRYYCFSKTIL